LAEDVLQATASALDPILLRFFGLPFEFAGRRVNIVIALNVGVTVLGDFGQAVLACFHPAGQGVAFESEDCLVFLMKWYDRRGQGKAVGLHDFQDLCLERAIAARPWIIEAYGNIQEVPVCVG
jgi:hypothetical protein